MNDNEGAFKSRDRSVDCPLSIALKQLLRVKRRTDLGPIADWCGLKLEEIVT